MSDFLSRLVDGPLVSDGATGTNLQKVGLEAGGHTEEWVLDRPQSILDLESSFVAAGADIILTCTFGATSLRLQGSKLTDRVEELNRRAVVLARQAAGTRSGVLVAGSIGPTGKLLKPLGPLTRGEAMTAFADQARGLEAGGLDLFVIETQFSMDEARAALDSVRQISDAPIVVSFSYDRGTRTMMGLKPADAARTFAQLGVAMIGVNCGTSLDNALVVIQEYRAAVPDLPVWAKPNAGLPRMQDGLAVYDVTPEQMGEFAVEAVRLGAAAVGGCCGTAPAHIRAIATAIAGQRPGP